MIIIGADHAGFELKDKIKNIFIKKNIEFIDVTDYEIDLKDDYVDIACVICKNVLKFKNSFAIAICGSGVGISIACNKIKGIRAGICYNYNVSQKMKEDNNCNVICFGGREEKDVSDVFKRIEIFISSEFKGERHERRIKKITELEEKFGDSL